MEKIQRKQLEEQFKQVLLDAAEKPCKHGMVLVLNIAQLRQLAEIFKQANRD